MFRTNFFIFFSPTAIRIQTHTYYWLFVLLLFSIFRGIGHIMCTFSRSLSCQWFGIFNIPSYYYFEKPKTVLLNFFYIPFVIYLNCRTYRYDECLLCNDLKAEILRLKMMYPYLYIYIYNLYSMSN